MRAAASMDAVAEHPSALSPRDHRRAQAVAALAPGPHLAIVDDDGGVAVLALREGRTTIGRSLCADVRLDDHTVSRRHAVVLRQGDRVTLVDERSTNGVLVNGVLVWRAELHDGDLVELGRVRLRFVHAHAR